MSTIWGIAAGNVPRRSPKSLWQRYTGRPVESILYCIGFSSWAFMNSLNTACSSNVNIMFSVFRSIGLASALDA